MTWKIINKKWEHNKKIPISDKIIEISKKISEIKEHIDFEEDYKRKINSLDSLIELRYIKKKNGKLGRN